FFFSSRRRHTRSKRDWSSDVCSSDLLFDKKLEHICKGISNFLSKRVHDYKVSVIMYQYLLFYNLPITPVLFKYQIKLRYLRCFEIGRASCRERVWRCHVDVRVNKEIR